MSASNYGGFEKVCKLGTFIASNDEQITTEPDDVMPVLMNYFVLLQRNLIYTGITRAKKILVMVGTKKALAYAVQNVTVKKGNTLLKE